MTVILPTEQPAPWLVTGGPETYTGVTHLGECSGIGLGFDAFYGEGELTALEAMVAHSSAFPALPDSGWLEQDDIYRWGGTLVMVRQSHNRAPYDPDETPALFCVYREGAGDVLDWVAGESVSVGTRRIYVIVEYRCLQAHVTQADWTPPVVPALWSTTIEPGENWAIGVFYDVDALTIYESIEYRCLQAHVSQADWQPPNVPALWIVNAPPTQEWAAYTAYTGDNTAGPGNGDVVTYSGNEYRCRQTHNSLPGWEPPNVPALWLAI
jgi:hypothetical protein